MSFVRQGHQVGRKQYAPLFSFYREGLSQEIIDELIQTARHDEHPKHDQNDPSHKGEEAGGAAERSQEGMETLHQEADEQKRQTQPQGIGEQEKDALQQRGADRD